MPHVLPPLPYPYGALEPTIDELTMRIHHDKHHGGYVAGLNDPAELVRAIGLHAGLAVPRAEAPAPHALVLERAS